MPRTLLFSSVMFLLAAFLSVKFTKDINEILFCSIWGASFLISFVLSKD
jgi:hypothetical protein